ncbi:Branched-chain-amino-acid aminotransferase, cytosolic [Labeo rohita]|uniref:Branched-chain-amino-acid aminotransferase, mitochondrial n=1 Tax=Labeo rohita TaxID=84645 RepID=A0ABQ8MU18_LABRO|nr:Branched-chain-amino-acid aminotransferase, cytosolic [Labeo rohita]
MASAQRYVNKVVVVTGGTRGIGRGIVKVFVQNGAKVVFCAPETELSAGQSLESVLNKEGPGSCTFVSCDVTKEEDIKRLINVTTERFGQIDCLVNNAGCHPPHKTTDETTADEFRDLLNMNLVSYFLASKYALPYLRKTQGNIINLASIVASIGQKDAAPYVATKGAITAMTKAMAVDESRYQVRVNCISPSNIMTPMWEELASRTEDAAAAIREGENAQLIGRMGTEAESGLAALFLAADATFCTGIDFTAAMAAIRTALNGRFLQPLSLSCGSLRFVSSSFKAADLTIEKNPVLKPKPDPSTLVFGKQFSDHMLTVSWSAAGGWEVPQIKPFQNLSLHPASSALHYSVEVRNVLSGGEDNRIRLFRPMLNMERMYRSSERSCLPLFDKGELLKCINKLIEIDQEWVPYSTNASLYIRPTFIGTEVCLEQDMLCSSSSLGLLDLILQLEALIRCHCWQILDINYGPTIAVQNEAAKQGCQQVLWLYGESEEITEVGTMNLFIYWTTEKGEKELVTPPLDGVILPGVTRQSLLDLAREWELMGALEDGRVLEVFGSGTACVVCPVGSLLYRGQTYQIPTMKNGPDLAKRFYKELTDIQYGRTQRDWAPVIA